MRIPFTKRFDEQRKQYAFHFTCEYCMYFCVLKNACLHEYPNEMHLLSYYTGEESPKDILFCKQFELR
ncbi:MAG: hypothetical protein JXX29_14610 [Deltaproteobacteria bacterium]|nr:hypothetical protein [Deltaproteobacteria bacterium]MBN2672912.1 hypothetical protein [Deltaproteobacteria bacterium]